VITLPGFELMSQNLAAVAASYRRAEIWFFVLACVIGSRGELQRAQEAAGVPLRGCARRFRFLTAPPPPGAAPAVAGARIRHGP
jgi:hypothetical protein